MPSGELLKIHLSGGFRQNVNKRWKGRTVDLEIKDEWLERMNSIPQIVVTGTCAGHPEVSPQNKWSFLPHVLDFSRPWISFVIETDPRSFEPSLDARGLGRDVGAAVGDLAIVTTDVLPGRGYYDRDVPHVDVMLESRTIRAEMSDEQFGAWWEAILIRLESIFGGF